MQLTLVHLCNFFDLPATYLLLLYNVTRTGLGEYHYRLLSDDVIIINSAFMGLCSSRFQERAKRRFNLYKVTFTAHEFSLLSTTL